MKKQIAAKILGFYGEMLSLIALGYLKNYRPRVVVVAGSVGKTSTTQAIASVLGARFKVRATLGSYNTHHGVPMSIFGEPFPVTKIGWLSLIPRMWWRSLWKMNFDVLVLEVGTDRPGDLGQFAYLQPELGVLTAVTPEHMENFTDLGDVAIEEFSISDYCQKLVINRDMVNQYFIDKYATVPFRLIGNVTEYTARHSSSKNVTIQTESMTLKNVKTHLVGTHSLYGILAAVTVAEVFGMPEKAIRRGLEQVKPIAGRMQLLDGKKHSKIIDDTYNSSPEAVIAALDTLYTLTGKQRIALLGTMNELGKISPQAHTDIGNYCDPEKLDLVVTLGDLANKYTALAARQRGCEVIETQTPYEAGKVISKHLKSHAVILAKGSQNGVFAEESVKLLLRNWRDRNKLVRQTPYWLAIKRITFDDAPK
jgi:UDP-N-acetylmuramoyl-tripeptide--D-alanyl-D-alanine ligase